MKRMNKAVVGTLALTLAMGGLLWSDLPAKAAETTESVKAQVTSTAGKLGLGGLLPWAEKLASYLKLDEAALKEKLKTQTIAEVAAEQGVSREDMKQQMVGWIQENAGDMADKMLDAKMTKHGKRGGHGHHGLHMAVEFDSIAKLLGMTAVDLQEAVKSGKTIAALAQEKNVDVQKIIDVCVSSMTAALDQLLADGTLTQEQYDAKKAELAAKAEKMVNGELSCGGKGMGRGHGGKRGGGPFGTPQSDSEVTPPSTTNTTTAL